MRRVVDWRRSALMCCAAAGMVLVVSQSFAKPVDDVWVALDSSVASAAPGDAWVRPEVYQAVGLDRSALDTVLNGAPLETSVLAGSTPAEIVLPMPEGGTARFRFVEAPVMAPELAAQLPGVRTFLGQGIDDPAATVRFDITPQGFHAQVLAPSGAIYIDPLNRDDDFAHAVYYKRDYATDAPRPACTLYPNPDGVAPVGDGEDFLRSGGELRTYRLACAATGEYTAFHGGRSTSAQAAIVTAINRVTGVYERDLGIRMELVPNNLSIVYVNASTDPYTNDNGSTMLSQNQSNIDSVIGSANYDIGHVFSTGGGGVAYLGVICTSSKARGVTGQSSPIGDPFYIDYVAHEMGHQFGANHTFNGVNGSCSGGNRNGGTAYEPGSGTTIMAYAGICNADDLQSNSDPHFHHESIREIRNYVTSGSGNSCPVTTATGNADPIVDAGANYTIPANTPFVLTATASDADGGEIAYNWEERDLGPAQALSSGDNGSSPLFRSWDPTTDPSRTFPRLIDLLNNTLSLGERLPTTTRTMNFRCTVRDNQAGGGGVAHDDMSVSVYSGAGPFRVTSPNTSSEEWSGVATITWDPAGTDAAPVSAATVDILLSVDGGLSFPIVLASATANDGSEAIVVPNVTTTTARVKIQGTNNVFFDVSDAMFSVTAPGALAITLPDGPPQSVEPGIPTTFPVQIVGFSEDVVEGTPTLHYRLNGGAYAEAPLTALGGEMYEAMLPRATCDDSPEFYLSAEGDGGTVVTMPFEGSTAAFDVSVGIVTNIFEDDFQADQGWASTGNASEGLWERGVPVDNDRGDPPADYDGSGQCYLTENDPNDSNSDVDDGSAVLTSPVFDMPAGGTISYAWWLNDVEGGRLGSGDGLVVEMATNAAGTNWQQVRNYTTAAGTWRTDAIEVTNGSSTVRLRFTASDVSTGQVVEAAVDAFEIVAATCPEVGDADFDTDGDVDLADFARLQTCWGETGLDATCAIGDLNGDDLIDETDLEVFVIIQDGPK